MLRCSSHAIPTKHLPDLKLANILMSFENENVLASFINQQREQQMEYKIDSTAGRAVYRCHNDFGRIDGKEVKHMYPRITDFGLATRLDEPSAPARDGMVAQQLGLYPIQPDYYRAPEVILGCGWDFKADIWNFGVLMWNIIGATELFQKVQDAQGQYDAKSHLAEIVALLGPPPKELLKRSNFMSQHDWPSPLITEEGNTYRNARECFGGPFFDAEGAFIDPDSVPIRNLEDTISFLEDKDRPAFLSFARDMLAWDPAKRKTARELMDHPFLKLDK
ncbi:putative serine/threonine-protein kinase [Aspergillus mulundensis]|uniref:Protein kinase domain-containing protein n=1 Tax=Aspergillus mulundensis TaxID=1810919 RepID=A0A3D8SBB6_9EURO|nr:hypothetical protein DSM5745_03926 [Aspergillus mulundensis]RDW83600.1 hypothetical protein DSM5745_03926 [Aspergillus mulundensis]